jgi:phage/plasmid primase-like uncharacterized protein
MTAAFDDLVARARFVSIESEIARRAIKLQGKSCHLAGPCPVCGGTDRFGVNTRKQMFYCRRCKVGGDVVALVRFMEGVDFKTAVEILADEPHRSQRKHDRERERQLIDDEERRSSQWADAIWRGTVLIAGTPAETYLATRGIRLLPPTLRFHPGLRHPSGGTWPAMVALVTRGTDGAPRAIHRTFLVRDGRGKAPVDSQKMMLGPCRGGAVRLGVSGDVLMVGEGIETCLSASQATGHPAWAALSTSGLLTLELPDDARDVILLADGDAPGEAASSDCAWRWKREGRREGRHENE